MTRPAKRRRLKRGRDWHGWAWKPGPSWGPPMLFHWAEAYKPDSRPTESGTWVRVRFVEVAPRRRRK